MIYLRALLKDVLINGFKYYDITTQKEETIEFYNYHDHLKNFGFMWEHSPLEFKYWQNNKAKISN